jgi:uncharacterized coiled-coil protein SlyX
MAKEKNLDRSNDFNLFALQDQLDNLTQQVHNLSSELATLRNRVMGGLADQLAELKQHVAKLEEVMRKQGF